uniref:Uncharacterized protein n=1 Tax=Rhizophora mucronata TaxID=61149 RepID=A0A2P2J5S1_RHIMU
MSCDLVPVGNADSEAEATLRAMND